MDGRSSRLSSPPSDGEKNADRENMTLPASRKGARASLAPTRGILKSSNFDGDYTMPIGIHSSTASKKRRVSFAPRPTTHQLPNHTTPEPPRKKRATIAFAAPSTPDKKVQISPLRRSPRLHPELTAPASDDESSEMDMSMEQSETRGALGESEHVSDKMPEQASEQVLISLDSPSPGKTNDNSDKSQEAAAKSPPRRSRSRSPKRTPNRAAEILSPRRSPRLAARQSYAGSDMELSSIFDSRPVLAPSAQPTDSETQTASPDSDNNDKPSRDTSADSGDTPQGPQSASDSLDDSVDETSAMDLTQEVVPRGINSRDSFAMDMTKPISANNRVSGIMDKPGSTFARPRDSSAMDLSRPLGTTISKPRDSIAMDLTRPLGGYRPRESNAMELTRPLGATISAPRDSLAMDFTRAARGPNTRRRDSNIMELTRPLRAGPRPSVAYGRPRDSLAMDFTRPFANKPRDSLAMDMTMPMSAKPRDSIAMDMTMPMSAKPRDSIAMDMTMPMSAKPRDSIAMDVTMPISAKPRDSIAMDMTVPMSAKPRDSIAMDMTMPMSAKGGPPMDRPQATTSQPRDSLVMDLTTAFRSQRDARQDGSANRETRRESSAMDFTNVFKKKDFSNTVQADDGDETDMELTQKAVPQQSPDKSKSRIMSLPETTRTRKTRESDTVELAKTFSIKRSPARRASNRPRDSSVMELTQLFRNQRINTGNEHTISRRDSASMDLTSSFKASLARTSVLDGKQQNTAPLDSETVAERVRVQDEDELEFTAAQAPRRLTMGHTPKPSTTPKKTLGATPNLRPPRTDATPTLDLTSTFLQSRGMSTQQASTLRLRSPRMLTMGSPLAKGGAKTPQRVPTTPRDNTATMTARTPAERLMRKILTFTPKNPQSEAKESGNESVVAEQPEAPDAPTEKLTVHQFLDMAGVTFMDEFLAANRRESSFGISNQTVTQTMPKLIDFVAASHRLPVREMYGSGASDLRRSIKSAKEGFAEYENQILEERPSLINDFLEGSKEERSAISAELMRMKTFGRLHAKGAWYDWRLTNTRTLKKHLDSHKEELLADKEALLKEKEAEQQKSDEISSKFDELLHRLEQLKQQQEQQENTDRDEYVEAQNRVASLKKEVGQQQEKLRGHTSELEALQEEQRALVVRKQEIWQEILDTEAIMQENQLTDDQEVLVLQEHVKWLMRVLGIRECKPTTESVTLTLAHELKLTVDLESFDVSHTIDTKDPVLRYFYAAFSESLAVSTANGSLATKVLHAVSMWFRAMSLYDTTQLLSFQFQTQFGQPDTGSAAFAINTKLLLPDALPVTVSVRLSPLSLQLYPNITADVKATSRSRSLDEERLNQIAAVVKQTVTSRGLGALMSTLFNIMKASA